MEGLRSEMSPRVLARIGGALYLVIIIVGLYGEVFIRNKLAVPGNAAATAANIKAFESLWRFGIATELLLLICAIALLAVLYILLRPVSRNLAMLAVLFNLIAIAVEATITLDLIEALFPLGTAVYLSAFTPAQLHAMTVLSLRSHGYGFGVSLAFFGCFCVIIGYLIFRSGYIPKTIGVLMQIAGLSYLINSFALILAPALADRLFPAILVPAFIGEASLCLWLLAIGVNVKKWELKADVRPTPM